MGVKNNISVEYLIDLLASIKSALGNIDSNGDALQTLISDLSENFTVLSELSKRQYQDGKEISAHLAIMQESIHELNISNQMVHADIINKVDHIIELMNLFGEMQKDLHFVAENIRNQTTIKAITSNIKPVAADGIFVRWSGNLKKIFTNLDVVGKAIIGILLSVAMLMSILKITGSSLSDLLDIPKIVTSITKR